MVWLLSQKNQLDFIARTFSARKTRRHKMRGVRYKGPGIRNPKPQSLNPKPQLLNPKALNPQALNPAFLLSTLGPGLSPTLGAADAKFLNVLV